MKHFSIYHDHDERGDVPLRSVFRAFTKSRFTQERVERDLLNSRVWLIMGHGQKPRRYSLCYWFIAETFIFAQSPGDEHRVVGSEGQQFLPPLQIDDQDWFPAFKSTAFYSRGLAEITVPDVIDGLLGLAESAANHQSEEDNPEIFDLQEIDDSFAAEVLAAWDTPAADLAARLSQSSPYPERIDVVTTAFRRNPAVVVAVLRRANGVCEKCGRKAPFVRQSDGSPYLEVHHWDRLADGGADTVDNAGALCPNCHRESHYG